MSSLLSIPLLDTLSSAPRSHNDDSTSRASGDGPAGLDIGGRRDISRPSIFELLAQEELRGMIQPAFRYILAWLANHRPRYFLRLVHRHEEVYASILTLVEWWHLTNHGASFSEHFYGLVTSPLPLPSTSASRPSSRLTRRQKWGYIGCLVGIPYLRLKLNDLYGSIRVEDNPSTLSEEVGQDGRTGANLPTRRKTLIKLLRKLFVLVYPYLNLLYETSLVGYDLKYMFDPDNVRTSWRPWLRYLGLEIIRAPPSSLPTNVSSHPPRSRLSSILHTLHTLLLKSTTNLLPLTLLTLKALQWWYSPQSPRLLSVVKRDRMRVPGPEMALPGEKGRSWLNLVREVAEKEEVDDAEDIGEGDIRDEDGHSSSDDETETIKTPMTSPKPTLHPSTTPIDQSKPYLQLPYGLCPICKTEWRNPTVTPTGYVGCYLCLYHDVKREGTCPVTGLRMRVEELRKVLV